MNFEQISNHLGKIQERVRAIEEQKSEIKASAESGAGMVKATANGNLQLTSLDIDSTLLTSKEKEMAEDLIIAAVNLALDKVSKEVERQVKQETLQFFNPES